MYGDGEAQAVAVRPPSQLRTVTKQGQVCGGGEVQASGGGEAQRSTTRGAGVSWWQGTTCGCGEFDSVDVMRWWRVRWQV